MPASCALFENTVGLTMNDPSHTTRPTPANPDVAPPAAESAGAPPRSEPMTPAGTASAPSVPPRNAGWAMWINPWVVVAILALLVAGWQAYDTRTRISGTQKELARRLAASETAVTQNRALVQAAQDQAGQLQTKLGELENRLAESQSQHATLEKLYQDLARGREEWVLAEVEQGITLAAQQLQLAGNVQGAVLALRAADARLAASNRPQFISLRKVLLRDLDRLQAQPVVDYPGINLRLDSVITAIDSLPLVVDGRPRDTTEHPEMAPWSLDALMTRDFWSGLGREIWGEIRALVRIQRFDRAEPVLLAPGQIFFLRENLKLRLLNARLALLMRDQWTFRNELMQAQAWLERHFDTEASAVRTAQTTLAQLLVSDVAPEIPTLNASLSALNALRAGKEPR